MSRNRLASFAPTSRSVLTIDGDHRQSSAQRYFGLPYLSVELVALPSITQSRLYLPLGGL